MNFPARHSWMTSRGGCKCDEEIGGSLRKKILQRAWADNDLRVIRTI
jgi:hypothetical protein